MRRVRCKRLLLSISAFAAAYVIITYVWAGTILDWIINLGRAAGCDVVALGRIVWMDGGPFVGDGLKTRLFNLLAVHGVWVIGAMVGLAAAMSVYAGCRALERFRPLGYRGLTRCGGCGYGLTELHKPRCPECGVVI